MMNGRGSDSRDLMIGNEFGGRDMMWFLFKSLNGDGYGMRDGGYVRVLMFVI